MFSFQKRKQQVDVGGFIRRLVDLTSPSRPPLEGEGRSEIRSNRSIPALLTPWEGGAPVVNDSVTALTKDFGDRGLALVLQQPFRAAEVVVGFWIDSEPRFVLGRVRQNVALGGGFWQLGVALQELVNTADTPQLQPLVPLAADLRAETDRDLGGLQGIDVFA